MKRYNSRHIIPCIFSMTSVVIRPSTTIVRVLRVVLRYVAFLLKSISILSCSTHTYVPKLWVCLLPDVLLAKNDRSLAVFLGRNDAPCLALRCRWIRIACLPSAHTSNNHETFNCSLLFVLSVCFGFRP